MADRNRDRRRRAYRLGHRAEILAALLLVLKGYRIVARRFRTPVGEIDLIVRRGRRFAFVEVKARDSLAAAADAVSRQQRSRVLRAAEYWLAQNPQAADSDLRFDAVLISRRLAMRHLKDAFQG